MEEEKRKNLVWTLVIISVLAIFIGVLAGFLIYGKQGLNIIQIFLQFQTYAGPAAFALVAILVIYITEKFFISKDDKLYGDYINFNNPGEGSASFLKSFKNPFKLFLIALGIFLILGLFAKFAGQTYLGIGGLEQQFTKTDGIIFNWLMVVTSENLGAAALAAISILFLRMGARKYKWEKTNFLIYSIFITVLAFTIFGFINHQLRYSGQEANLLKVLGFWAVSGLITALSGSFIPAYVLHGVNNTYGELNFARDFISVIPVIVVVAIIIFIYYYLFIRKTKKESLPF